MFDDDLDKLFRDLIAQWNVAERRIKKAEQVQGNEVVNSAIFELRYAGRKVVDALQLIQNGDWKNNKEIYEQTRRYLADAIEDCVKAKHDAIDAMIDFVTTWFDAIEKQIGLRRLTQIFPEYLEVTARIVDVQDRIAHSREHRTKERDSVYDRIESEDYDVILALFNKMRLSRDRVEAITAADIFWGRVNTAGIVVNLVLAAVIAVGTIILVYLEVAKFLGSSHSP